MQRFSRPEYRLFEGDLKRGKMENRETRESDSRFFERSNADRKKVFLDFWTITRTIARSDNYTKAKNKKVGRFVLVYRAKKRAFVLYFFSCHRYAPIIPSSPLPFPFRCFHACTPRVWIAIENFFRPLIWGATICSHF